LGITGQGAVVADFDTGVDLSHPALIKHYRGNLGNGQFNHNYNWFEPDSNLYANGNLGASVSSQPHDCDGHGTHTMGTAVGTGDGPGEQIGMAPGATWIAMPGLCFGTMPGGINDDIGALKAFQWLFCPTDLTGDLATADCSKAPDVVNNSWGSANPLSEVLRPAIQKLRAAGIAPVFASGNPSAGPGSIGTPANAPEAITVGATDSNDQVAYFSGRGPSFYAGVQKPQLTAPGVAVLSSIPGGNYIEESGTSMAAPHVTGLIALMVAADLRDGVRDFDVDELERFMNYTAIDLGKPGPDNDYGYGRINAYEAVRWVLSAGDLRGKVVDATTKLAIAKAQVRGINNRPTNNFSTATNSTGLYSITVPAGDYRVQVAAWGYYSATFTQQTVFAHALSQADFALRPLPQVTLSGFVRSGNAPVAQALIYAEQRPEISTYSNADGSYTLVLPVGTQAISIRTPGQRVQQTQLTLGPGPLSHDFALQSAPAILLVDADAQGGWFSGWSTVNVFQAALDDAHYQYDSWRIQYTDITGTKTLLDGSIGYGIPPLATLQQYQVVIWAHHGCSYGCYSGGTPHAIGTDQTLARYLDQGGRLILSGQDIGTDNGTAFFDRYLHARQELVNAASTDDTLAGAGFLQGINLTITNASLYGYANGYINLSPDGVAPATQDGAAYPVLMYADNQSGAALAIDSCAAPYRAVYFAVGFENIGPRAGNRGPALADALDRSIAWVAGNKPSHNLSLWAKPTTRIGAAGGRTSYQLYMANTGALTATVQLAFTGNAWPTQLLDGAGNALGQPFVLGPCTTREFALAVDVPAAAHATDKDNVSVSAAFVDNLAPAQSLALTTVAFPSWQTEQPLPTVRFGFGATALPNTPYLYTLGGVQISNAGSGYKFFSTNERYDTCARRWETMAPLPVAIGFPSSAVLNGKLYVVGGDLLTTQDQSMLTPNDQVYVYDPANNQWSTAAKLPMTVTTLPVATIHGQLYALVVDDIFDTTHLYAYDPAQNRWQEKSSPPGTDTIYIAAAALNGKLYGARLGLEQLYFDVYDPATDSWASAAPLNTAIVAVPGLTAGPDGFLYATGIQSRRGGASLAERYDPQNNRWEIISNLNNQYHFGAAAVYATGRIFTVNGLAGEGTEALPITDSFCLSDKTTQQATVTSGGHITYTVKLNADTIDLSNVAVTDPLPARTTFVGFGTNNVGAVYNAAQRQIEWRGALPAHRPPLYFTYELAVTGENVQPGEVIGNPATFDNGNTLHFTRVATSTVITLDLSASSKAVDRAQALSGEVLTYTIDVRGRSTAGGPVSVQDTLPVGATYVPDSLRFTDGAGHYDDATRSIVWDNVLRAGANAYLNTTDDYIWGDSDGNGQLPQVRFDWVDISQSGKVLSGGDDLYICNLPIGFEFTFYGATKSTFCLSSNGLISFNATIDPGYSNVCPFPAPTAGSDQLIAALWDDLVINESMHYQTLGVAPNRRLVVQWEGVHSYATPSARDSAFQLILYENG
ncbi:MAG: S8 family serine peptidase, partial [Chloroflexi bacterium]|nr:S8 family serine peptidase [Chloroflexota bacterium]